MVGLVVLAGGRAYPTAHVVYESEYLDNGYVRSELEYGTSIYGCPTGEQPRTKKDKSIDDLRVRPDLFTLLHAAALLNRELEEACIALDEKLGLKQL
jgi:hypothetical protein